MVDEGAASSRREVQVNRIRLRADAIPTMTENILIPLPGFELSGDYPWRIGFVALVDDQLRRLRATGHFLPPRFFGYYFQGAVPIAVGGSWTVSLDPARPATQIPEQLEKITHGQYGITS